MDGRDPWNRAWLAMAHVPWAALVVYALVVAVRSPEELVSTDPFAVALLWVPLGLHVPLHVGAVRYLLWRQGARWLRWGPLPLVLYCGLFALGGGEGLLLVAPFLAAAVFAHVAGRRIADAAESALPPLPDAEEASAG